MFVSSGIGNSSHAICGVWGGTSGVVPIEKRGVVFPDCVLTCDDGDPQCAVVVVRHGGIVVPTSIVSCEKRCCPDRCSIWVRRGIGGGEGRGGEGWKRRRIEICRVGIKLGVEGRCDPGKTRARWSLHCTSPVSCTRAIVKLKMGWPVGSRGVTLESPGQGVQRFG
jgi:hypothetical protein